MADIIESEFEGEINSQSAIAFNIPDLKAMAAKILRRANEVAQQKIAAAKKTVEDMEKKARADGQEKGYADGLKKAETEGRAAGDKAAREEFVKATGPIAGALQAALKELAQKKQTLQADAEADLLRLALEIARRIIRREVAFDPAFAVAQVREAIALTNNRSDLIVWLNPEDRAAVEKEMPNLQALFSDLGRVELREDAALERGGTRVTGRDGEVDMRLATQLQTLELALVGDTHGLNLPPAGTPAVSAPAQKLAEPVQETVVAEPNPVAPAPKKAPSPSAPVAAEPAPKPAESAPEKLPEAQATAPEPAPAAAPQEAEPVSMPVSAPEESGGNSVSPAPAPAAPQAPTAPKPAGAPPKKSEPGIVDPDAAQEGFVEGVVNESAYAGTSSLSGLASINDIPLDSSLEKLMDDALRGKG